MLLDAARNHESWFGRGRERVELEGATLFVGNADAMLAFPRANGDLAGAVGLARAAGVREVGCWSLAPDTELAERLKRLGFQDGWQPHWMGIDAAAAAEPSEHAVEQTTDCDRDLPYHSQQHVQAFGDDVHHLVVRTGGRPVGHAVLHVAGDAGGIYDMGVSTASRRRGIGGSLTRAAVALARGEGCASVTLNATGEGEPMYRSVGFRSLGHGMTWWLFPGRP